MGYVIYELPFLSNAQPLVRHLAGGWQVNSIFAFQSGSPFSVFDGSNRALNGVGGDRPNLVGDPKLDSGRPKGEKTERYFNTAAFQLNDLGTYGTSGRNIVRGPGLAKVDLSFFKNITFKDRYSVQLRAEAFNAFNRTNFGNPNTTITSSLFGKIRTANDARVLQLALRLGF